MPVNLSKDDLNPKHEPIKPILLACKPKLYAIFHKCAIWHIYLCQVFCYTIPNITTIIFLC